MSAVRNEKKENRLGYENIATLLRQFAVPSIISGVVSATYNIVDQFFIGRGIGIYGNAATNVAFPFTTICVATALLLGIGGSSGFNLAMGAKEEEKAKKIAGNTISALLIAGVAIGLITLVFLKPLLRAFGASDAVMPYAEAYTGILAFGMPFFIFSTGASSLIRADGSPGYSMACVLSGAIINTVLDPLFIFTFDMGMEGAALATIIGQIVSGAMVAIYFFRFDSFKITPAMLRPRLAVIGRTAALGAASFFNQIAILAVQVVMNNSLTYYGAQSPYGSEIPMAVVGIGSKVNFLFMSVIIGIAQGNQPIVGYNYGAKNYGRVRRAYKLAAISGLAVSTVGFILFQLFPTQIVGLFGDGTPQYFEFAERYFRIFMMFFFIVGIHPVTSNFFTAIGKAKKGIVISLTRQIIILLPLLLIFPLFFGVDGLIYAGPFSDGISATIAIILVANELKNMKEMEQNQLAAPR